MVYLDSPWAQKPCPPHPTRLRDELIDNEIIIKKGESLVLASDYLFSSPSAAAAVIMGRSANGLIEWKNSKGKELKSVEESEISKANKSMQPTSNVSAD
ncbi:DUF4357 domain-containing protein [Methylomonas sp.]|uniref:DUF4357 domain-containing protein n=1 Tax=Methylomonas sp. TaxID=418 RepID=UPI00342ECEA0